MPVERYFINAPFSAQEEVSLDPEEAHHLIHVIRTKVGDIVELVNGKHQWAKAEVLSIRKKEVVLKILETKLFPSPSFKIILCQGIPRFHRLEMVAEKGTELGMHALWLFPGERSEKKEFSENQRRRLQAILISAMKQCGRGDLPEICIKPSLAQWKELPCLPAYFGDVSTEAPLLSEIWQPSAEACFFVGPESGFSEKETDKLRRLGACGAKLHANILRTDTASLMALSLLSHR